MSDFFKLLFILFCSCAASAQMVMMPRKPRVPYRLPAAYQPRREVSIPLKPMVPYRLHPAATAQHGTQQGTSLAGLRRRLLERLAVNRQFQQMASSPPAPSQDVAPQSGISNMLDSILTMRSQRGSSLSSKPNTQILTRSSAIQNLQRRFGGHSSSFSSDMGFQNQMKDQSVFGSMFKPRTTPAAPPKPNIQLSISRSSSSRSLMDQSPSSFISSSTGFPRSSSGLDPSSTNLISSRPSFQSSATSTSLSSPSRSGSSSSALGNVLSASSAINSAAAARGHLSDLIDTRMDLMSDMMEAGMMNGFGGGMNFGMGNMFGSGFGGNSAGAGLFGGLGGLSFL